MEHPRALRDGGGTYRWHAGAPDDEAFARAHARARRPDPRDAARPAARAGRRRSKRPSRSRASRSRVPARERVTDEYVAAAYGDELLALVGERPELVVLDADLASDCRIRAFELAQPDALRRGRDRRAGHGLDGRRSGAPGAAAGRQLLRQLPRLARERADLQPGERADEGRLRAALRRPDPGRPGQVAPEHPRRLAARGAAERDRRAARELRGDARAAALGGRGAPARTSRCRLAIGPSPRADRASRRRRVHARAGHRPARGRATRCSSPTGR